MDRTLALLALMSSCQDCDSDDGEKGVTDTDPPADTEAADTDMVEPECPPDVVSVRFEGEEAGVFTCPSTYIAISAFIGTERPCHCSAETTTVSEPFGGPPSNWDFRLLPETGSWYASLCVPASFWEAINQDVSDIYFLCYWPAQ